MYEVVLPVPLGECCVVGGCVMVRVGRLLSSDT